MDQILSYMGIVTGVLVLVVGFGFHWIGQLISLLDRDLAVRIGIWEKEMPPEYEVYENAMALADVAIGWMYGIAGAGLVLGASWGFRLAWVPGIVLIYHSISFRSWTANQKRAGHPLQFTREPARTGWFAANFITGALAVLVAWAAG